MCYHAPAQYHCIQGARLSASFGCNFVFNQTGGERITRVLVIGLDGATWDVLRPLATDGRLPHLQQMMQKGAHGVLQSTIPPVTPAAWTSVFTGKNPGRHGIYDFQKIDRQTYEFNTIRTHRHREKSLWQLTGEHGKRSILVDVPFTFPPQPFEGLMITGYGTPRTPDTVFTYPRDLTPILPAELHSQIRVALPDNSFDRSQRFIDEWAAIMDGRRALLRYLIAEQAWDYFMVVFSITDNMAHVFWTYVDPAHPNYYRAEAERYRRAFFESYEQCDRLLGEMMEAAGRQTTTLVISDHGFGSVRPRQYLFQRLLQGGYLRASSERRRGTISSALLKLAVQTYSRFPAIRETVKGLRPGRRQLLKDTLQKAGALPNASAVDYARSQIILSNFGLQLWINEEGRFAGGTVSPGHREHLLNTLTEYLLADLDPVTAQPVIRTVHRGQDVYEGPFVSECPDLIIEYNNSFSIQGHEGQKNGHTEGGHTHEGIFLSLGADVIATEVSGARLIDLAPTVLHLLGLPVPPDVDGRILEEMLTAAYRQKNVPRIDDKPAISNEEMPSASYSAQEDEELREQLRQLGYL